MAMRLEHSLNGKWVLVAGERACMSGLLVIEGPRRRPPASRRDAQGGLRDLMAEGPGWLVVPEGEVGEALRLAPVDLQSSSSSIPHSPPASPFIGSVPCRSPFRATGSSSATESSTLTSPVPRPASSDCWWMRPMPVSWSQSTAKARGAALSAAGSAPQPHPALHSFAVPLFWRLDLSSSASLLHSLCPHSFERVSCGGLSRG